MYHRKLQSVVSSDLANIIEIIVDQCVAITLGYPLLALVTVSAVVFVAAKLISVIEERIKYENLESIDTDQFRAEKLAIATRDYGTISGEDREKGDVRRTISCDDLYDGKLCVICYDQQRDSFFVPCGHCATCNICAKRILYAEEKVCPVCRRLIGKVKRLPWAS